MCTHARAACGRGSAAQRQLSSTPAAVPTSQGASEANRTQPFRGGSLLAGPPLPLISMAHRHTSHSCSPFPKGPDLTSRCVCHTDPSWPHCLSRLVPAPGPHCPAVSSPGNAHTPILAGFSPSHILGFCLTVSSSETILTPRSLPTDIPHLPSLLHFLLLRLTLPKMFPLMLVCSPTKA